MKDEALLKEAVAHQRAGRLAEAAGIYEAILAQDARQADAHHNLGVLELQRHHPKAALPHLQAALAIHPGHTGYRESHAKALQLTGQTEAAAEAWFRLATLLREKQEFAKAATCCQKATALRPAHIAAWNNLGNLLTEIGEPERAEAAYRQALRLAPHHFGAAVNLGNLCMWQGRWQDAETSFRLAGQGSPEGRKALLLAELLLPAIPASREEIALWRAHYREGIARLLAMPGEFDDIDQLNLLTFYLAYHDEDDRAIMASLADMLRRKSPGLVHTAAHLALWQPPRVTGRRARIGFVSRNLAAHTIGKLFHGFIHHLDRRRFEVTVLHFHPDKPDPLRAHLDALADRSITLTGGVANHQRQVAELAPDILFYPDIGMAPESLLLAHARLAPVQVVAWGHPDTTGLPEMDYFLSSALIEPQGADSCYSERLIRLSVLPCRYSPVKEAPRPLPSREELGLPADGTLFGCLQSLFKLHPDFDAALAAIVTGDPEARIVLVEGQQPSWTTLLRKRWEHTHPVLLERTLLLPRMATPRFLQVSAHMDLMLDPFHFGGGNTFYEAMGLGIPMVTWPGRFMRGRVATGGYRQMGLADPPVAASREAYAALALDLARDAPRRQALGRACRENAHKLYADQRAVRELETFLEAALQAATRRERLPEGWSPASLLPGG
ncbi:MAG: tetratricopeptide repeat protein [Magnetococcales bacterium]|nr:tetratricopeptide repeat protein [Magnetococcales bacterium]